MISTQRTYRNLLKAIKPWPQQEEKAARLKEFLTQHIKTSFRRDTIGETAEQLREKLNNANLQIDSIKRLLGNESQKKFGPEKDSSLLLGFLPPKKLFALLEKKTQDELKEKSQLSFLKYHFSRNNE